MTRANTAVTAEFKRLRELNPKSTQDAISSWAAAAIDIDKGEAFWEHAAVGRVSVRCVSSLR